MQLFSWVPISWVPTRTIAIATMMSAALMALATAAMGQPMPLLAPITEDDLEAEVEAGEQPLVPDEVADGDRPLTPAEATQLDAQLDALRAEGAALYAIGDVDGAYAVWVRELRYRQFLERRNEIEALNVIGQTAAADDRTDVLRAAGDRLEVVEQSLLDDPMVMLDLDLMTAIAQTYEAVRKKDAAIAAYGRILERSRQQQNLSLEMMTLATLGQIYVSWFEYASAAATYQELLVLAQNGGDRRQQIEILEQLAAVYDAAEQYELAIVSREDLIRLYTEEAVANADPTASEPPQVMAIARLKLAIANSYRALEQYGLAAVNYQAALAAAQATQQFGYAGDAVRQLAEMYTDLERYDDAIFSYRLLMDVERQSYSTYGVMDAYDEIGKLERDRRHVPEAIAAFEQGYRLAAELGFREAYFQRQLDSMRPAMRPQRRPFEEELDNGTDDLRDESMRFNQIERIEQIEDFFDNEDDFGR
jgi:tetratricopeptide (TPR) repeat protein